VQDVPRRLRAWRVYTITSPASAALATASLTTATVAAALVAAGSLDFTTELTQSVGNR